MKAALRSKKSLILISFGILILMALKLGAERQEISFGHVIPPFKDVFVKLFRLNAEVSGLDQLTKGAADLAPEERVAVSNYLNDEDRTNIKANLSVDKISFLDSQYKPTGRESEGDFQKLYPHILAVSDNNLNYDQLIKTLDGLSEEDIASQSFFLGEEGRARFFSEIKLEATEEVLKRTPDWVLIDTGKKKYKSITDYSCIMYKQERLSGKLQGVEKIHLKYREKPWGIYMKWLDGPWTGRELVYSEPILGAGKVRVREKGILGIIPVTLPIDNPIAQRGSNHAVTEIGLINLLIMIEHDYRVASAKGELKRVNHGIEEVDGHQVFKTESILPQDPKSGYYCYRMMHYIDFLRSLEIKAEIFNWDDQLQESYLYTEIKINPGFKDKDFDPQNPEYNLK